jgi:acyl dehydratase
VRVMTDAERPARLETQPDLMRLAGYPTTMKQRDFDWDFLAGVDRYEVWDEIEIGSSGTCSRTFVVEEEDIVSFNLSALESDPLLVDPEHARGHGGLLHHPLFVVQVVFYCIDTGIGSWIRSPGARNPGQLIEVFEPFRLGEEITATITHVDKWIRRGHHYLEDRVELTNQAGVAKATWHVRLLLPPTRAELRRWASM